MTSSRKNIVRGRAASNGALMPPIFCWWLFYCGLVCGSIIHKKNPEFTQNLLELSPLNFILSNSKKLRGKNLRDPSCWSCTVFAHTYQLSGQLPIMSRVVHMWPVLLHVDPFLLVWILLSKGMYFFHIPVLYKPLINVRPEGAKPISKILLIVHLLE